jgi:glutamate 5-kinase
LVNYTSAQCKNIVGCQMDEISERLGAEAKSGEVAHRGNIVLMRDK